MLVQFIYVFDKNKTTCKKLRGSHMKYERTWIMGLTSCNHPVSLFLEPSSVFLPVTNHPKTIEGVRYSDFN